MKKSLFILFALFIGFVATSCSNGFEYIDTDFTPAYKSANVSRDITTDIVDNNGSELGITSISITNNGFETAIWKKTGELKIVFVIVNPTMNPDTINTSVYYLNSTKKLVSKMSMIDWFIRCHKLAENNELVTEYGYVTFNDEIVYMFNVAYNDIYVELFYE